MNNSMQTCGARVLLWKYRDKKKIKNMNNAVQNIFPDPFKLEFGPDKFTIDLDKNNNSKWVPSRGHPLLPVKQQY